MHRDVSHNRVYRPNKLLPSSYRAFHLREGCPAGIAGPTTPPDTGVRVCAAGGWVFAECGVAAVVTGVESGERPGSVRRRTGREAGGCPAAFTACIALPVTSARC